MKIIARSAITFWPSLINILCFHNYFKLRISLLFFMNFEVTCFKISFTVCILKICEFYLNSKYFGNQNLSQDSRNSGEFLWYIIFWNQIGKAQNMPMVAGSLVYSFVLKHRQASQQYQITVAENLRENFQYLFRSVPAKCFAVHWWVTLTSVESGSAILATANRKMS